MLRRAASRALDRALRRSTPPGRTIGENLAAFRAGVDLEHVAGLERPAGFERGIEIVVPCFNHAAYLPEAFASIEAQTRREPVTVTLVDDRSTDGTPRILDALRASAPGWIEVNVIHNRRNLRQWASINRAVSRSRNALFVILNDDDVLVPDCLEKICATYRANPEIFMLGAGSIWIEDGKPVPERHPRAVSELRLTVRRPEETAGYRELNDLNLTHSSSSFFRVAWEAVGGYRAKHRRVHPSASEDRDFQMRVNALFPVGVYEDYAFAYWRVGSSHGGAF